MIKNKTLDDAMLMHVNWLMRLENAAEANYGDTLDLAEIRDDTLCEFGQWLKENAKAFPEKNLYESITQLHRSFHHQASDVASMLQGYGRLGNIKVAFAKLTEVSDQLIGSLEKMKTMTAKKD
jgi:hypothetical protein